MPYVRVKQAQPQPPFVPPAPVEVQPEDGKPLKAAVADLGEVDLLELVS